MTCYKCVYKIVHPFHDNGTINDACDITPFTVQEHGS